MALFQLDSASIAARVRASSAEWRVPTLGSSILRGILGFTVVSVAGFSPWAILEWLHMGGEVRMYVACAAVFIGLSGLLLHRLIIGPGSLVRFYKLFALAFTAYAVAWVVSWMKLRGDEGSILGLLGGTVAMGAILALAFEAWRWWEILGTVIALFVFNTLGYYAGGWIAGKLVIEHRLAAMLLWGVCYGMGFGGGLGVAFHICQARARQVLRG